MLLRRKLFKGATAVALAIQLACGAYIDFGVKGKTYPIAEKNILSEIKEELDKYIKTEDFKKKVEEAVKKLDKYESDLPYCKNDKNLGEFSNVYKLPVDIVNPYGRVIKRKGEEIVLKTPKGVEVGICFVGGNETSVSNQIKSMPKKCLFLVSGTSTLKMREKFPDRLIYPSRDFYEKRFDIKCYPEMIVIKNDKITKTTFSYERFKTSDSSSSQRRK